MSTGPTWQSCTEGNVTHTDGQGAAGGDDVVDCTNERSTGLELCSGASSVLGQRKAVCADEDETTRNQQMFIALDSDFDPLLFDYNWIEGPSSISSNIGSNSNNCEIVNGETGTSQGVPSAGHGHPFGSHERTRTNPDLSSFSNEATQRFGVGQHVLPNDFLASSSASYSQAQNQAAQNSQPHIQGLLNPLASNHGQPVNENGWMDNAVLQTLAFNAMAAGANLAASESAIPAGFFLPTQLQQQVVEVPVPVTSTHAEQNGLQSDSKKPDLPPFLLFDAPIELRANFLACQKAHGLPTFVDNNTLHYQHHSNCGSFRLIDGRHGDVGNNRVKNEREQKRTQKIADLIDQLRENMERGGWQVGGSKSKYATLST